VSVVGVMVYPTHPLRVTSIDKEAQVDSLRAVSLQPFVPSGKEYDASRQLFKDLGFEEVWEHDGYGC
jgi:hypothetical protein